MPSLGRSQHVHRLRANRISPAGGTANVDTMASRLQVNRVALENFLSFATCDVTLGRLTFLVGRNGSGKSNFLYALRFVAESLRHSVGRALESHHGIYGALRRSPVSPQHFGIRLDCRVANATVQFAFIVALRGDDEFEVRREECRVMPDDSTGEGHHYSIREGQVSASFPNPPPVSQDRLYLLAASGIEAFRPTYDSLSRMGFYNLLPESIADAQPPDPGMVLRSDGGNLVRVISRMEDRAPWIKKRIEEYLCSVVPGVTGVGHASLGSLELLEFQQHVGSSIEPATFYADSMSDGTLRALGVLVALFQCADSSGPLLVGIEEPEDGLHPAASEILLDSLREAAQHAQVIVTSHSADLLDEPDVPAEAILSVVAEQGESRIGPLDEASRTSLSRHLFGAGELMRCDQLRIAPAVAAQGTVRFDLFEGMP